MAQAISLIRDHARQNIRFPAEALRSIIVTGCAVSLIAAGHAFPALGL